MVRIQSLPEVRQIAAIYISTALVVRAVLQEIAAPTVRHRWLVQRVELSTLHTAIEAAVGVVAFVGV